MLGAGIVGTFLVVLGSAFLYLALSAEARDSLNRQQMATPKIGKSLERPSYFVSAAISLLTGVLLLVYAVFGS